jgi:ribonucleoside-triphosphate reductase (thioredoxin)
MSNFLPTEYQQYIHLSRYSRFNHEENRRETWSETVSRYFNFFDNHLQKQCDFIVPPEVRDMLEEGCFNT